MSHHAAAGPVNPTVPSAIAAQKAIADGKVASGKEVATFASGCFWGTEDIIRKHYFNHGVTSTAVGYIGGDTSNPSYRQVCSGTTGHAEACKVEFDPSKVSFAELVEFFYRTHDPSTVDRQGPDRGSQYRSAIFTQSEDQTQIAKQVTQEVQEKHVAPKKIVTQIIQVEGDKTKWWNAEDYHQLYLENNPGGYECPTHRLWW